MIAFISNNLKVGLHPDSARYYRVLYPYKDFHPLPVRRKKEKKSVSVSSVSEQSSSNQDRVGPSSKHGQVEVGLMCTKARPYLIMIGGMPLPVTYKRYQWKTETEMKSLTLPLTTSAPYTFQPLENRRSTSSQCVAMWHIVSLYIYSFQIISIHLKTFCILSSFYFWYFKYFLIL